MSSASLDRRAYFRAYRKANLDSVRSHERKYKLTHKQQIKDRAAQYRDEHREELRVKGVTYYAKHREYQAAYRKQHRQRTREHDLKRNFGITLKQYEEMLSNQENMCAICRRPATQFRRGLHVNHDHTDGMVRGLLCTPCNIGLGGFRDNPDLLVAAIKYLSSRRGGHYEFEVRVL